MIRDGGGRGRGTQPLQIKSDIKKLNICTNLQVVPYAIPAAVAGVKHSKPLSVFKMCKGVYPQSDRSLAIVDIDASKGFVDLWIHFFVAIVDIHRNGYRQKVLFFGFD